MARASAGKPAAKDEKATPKPRAPRVKKPEAVDRPGETVIEKITVSHGKEVYSPVPYHTFEIGPMTVSLSLGKDDKIGDVVTKAQEFLATAASTQFTSQMNAFFLRCNQLDEEMIERGLGSRAAIPRSSSGQKSMEAIPMRQDNKPKAAVTQTPEPAAAPPPAPSQEDISPAPEPVATDGSFNPKATGTADLAKPMQLSAIKNLCRQFPDGGVGPSDKVEQLMGCMIHELNYDAADKCIKEIEQELKAIKMGQAASPAPAPVDPQPAPPTEVTAAPKPVEPPPPPTVVETSGDPKATNLNDMITAKQLGLIRAIAREGNLDAERECQAVMKCNIDELSKKGASDLITHLTAVKDSGVKPNYGDN